MNIKFTSSFYLRLVAIAITGVVKSLADDTASGLDPTMGPTMSPSPSGMGSDIPSTIIPSDMVSDIPSDMVSDIPSDLPSDLPSLIIAEGISDVPSYFVSDVPTTIDMNTRRDEDSGATAVVSSFLGMVVLSMGLFF